MLQDGHMAHGHILHSLTLFSRSHLALVTLGTRSHLTLGNTWHSVTLGTRTLGTRSTWHLVTLGTQSLGTRSTWDSVHLALGHTWH